MYGLIPSSSGGCRSSHAARTGQGGRSYQILTQPRNAITRQYVKLFEYENVKLRFSDDCARRDCGVALERKIGARGLRMIIETDARLMYQVPTRRKSRGHHHTGSGAREGQADNAHREGRIAEMRLLIAEC